MAQDVVYGTSMADKVIRFFRIKSDHSMIQLPKATGDTIFSDIDDAEFASKIIGNIAITSQDDGSNQIQFVCAAYGAKLLDFLNAYKVVESAKDKTKFTAAHGEEWGGSGSGGTADQLLVVIHGAPDPETGKVMVYAFICYLEVANTGGHTIQPNEVAQLQITARQVKPKANVILHTGVGGTPSVLNNAVIDFTTETTNIVMTTDSFKYHFPAKAVA